MSKTVLITGASSGIGASTAQYFHEKGWNVSATMRDLEGETRLNQLPKVKCLQLDVTDKVSIQRAIHQTIEHFGKIDVLVNNAGYSLHGPFEGATPEQIQKQFDVNVFGVMNVTRAILPHLRELGGGCIINVTSLGGRIGMPLSSNYNASKWAVEGMSEALMYELSSFKIKVKIIEPGSISTNFAKNAIIVRKDEVKVYRDMIEKRLANFQRRQGNQADPMIVAKVIYQAANDSGHRLRYIAGNDAKFAWRLRQVLPFRTFAFILKRIAGQ